MTTALIASAILAALNQAQSTHTCILRKPADLDYPKRNPYHPKPSKRGKFKKRNR